MMKLILPKVIFITLFLEIQGGHYYDQSFGQYYGQPRYLGQSYRQYIVRNFGQNYGQFNGKNCIWVMENGQWTTRCVFENIENPEFCEGTLTIYHEKNHPDHPHSHIIE